MSEIRKMSTLTPPSSTSIILNYILSDNRMFTNLYDTCFTNNYHKTEKKLRQVFEEFFANLDEPPYIRQLLVHCAQETDFLEVAIKMEKNKISHYIYA